MLAPHTHTHIYIYIYTHTERKNVYSYMHVPKLHERFSAACGRHFVSQIVAKVGARDSLEKGLGPKRGSGWNDSGPVDMSSKSGVPGLDSRPGLFEIASLPGCEAVSRLFHNFRLKTLLKPFRIE